MRCPKCHFENSADSVFCGMCGIKLKVGEKTCDIVTESLPLPEKELTIGSIFAERYLIIEELGKGGMGKVYQVFDREIKEKVALKLLNPEIAGDDSAIERFRNELRLARRISHKNVCRMFDLHREGNISYITMEYVPGEDLKSTIKRTGPLSTGKAIFITKQVCQGLAEAHRLGVVHRDLKPQNIMVDREGDVRIMDFGIARWLKTKGVTETGVIIGTPEYMSVEQVEGKDVDQRSDIYSLGVILYEMVTGKSPFEGDTPLSIAVKHTTQAPEDPKKLNDQIPEDLSSVILKCMEKKRGNRFQSVEQLLAELREIEKGVPTTERLVPQGGSLTSKQVTLTFNLNRFLIRALVLVVLMVGALVVWHNLHQDKSAPITEVKPAIAVLPFTNSSKDKDLDHWRTGLSELLTADLRQSRYIRVLDGDRVFRILSNLNLQRAEKYSPEDLKKVANQARVSHILKGSFFVSGKNMVIILMVQDPHQGSLISSRRLECKGEDQIFHLIDDLTESIKSDLSLSGDQIAKDKDGRLMDIVTGSVDAYRYYMEGWVNYLEGGDHERTIQLWEKATAVDPQFAKAYQAMARVYGELDLIYQRWDCLQKALELKDRLPQRDLLLVRGELYGMRGKTYDQAIKTYERLLWFYPEDREGNLNLGLLYCSDLEQWDKAIERLEVLIKNNEESCEPYLYQAEAYMARGLYDKSREVLESYLKRFPEKVWILEKISNVYLCQRKLGLAFSVANKALSLDSTSVYPSFMGDVHYYRGDLAKAEKEYQRLLRTRTPSSRFHGWFRLAALYLSQGRYEESKEQLKLAHDLAEEIGAPDWKVWSHWYSSQLNLISGEPERALEDWEKANNVALEESLDWQPDLYLRGRIHLGMNSTDQAQKAAEELEKNVDAYANKKLKRYYYHLLGMIELERENYLQAISNFKIAISFLPFQHSELDDHALFIYPLAEAYYRAGDLEKALQWYRSVVSLTTGRLFYGDLFAKSLYMQGKIYQEMGFEVKAKENYSRFIQLFGDADLEICKVGDAKDRLKELSTGS